MSLQVTAPLVLQIVSQAHEPPDDAMIRSLQLTTRRERDVRVDDKLEDLGNSLPEKTKRAVDLAAGKGASSWLTVIPVKEMDLNLNKREFKAAVHLRYDWQISDVPNFCVCGEPFNVDHAMICKRGWGGGGASLYNTKTSCGVWRSRCLTWSVMMLKMNLFCRRLPVSR